jgi:dienelactone hydrolase
MIPCFSLVALVLLNVAARADDPPPSDTSPALVLKTKSGVRYGIWPKKPEAPAPTLFIFAGSVEDSLNTPYFRQCGNQLAKEGYLCVSVDLPCHGPEVRGGEPAGIAGWRARIEKGEDFVAEATTRFRAVLDDLVELKLADPERIAACGTSRGGFMAVHFAASDPRIKAAAAFAPLTDMLVIDEFKTLEKRDLAERLSLKSQAGKLAGRAVWLIIGDRDSRVSTDESIAFCRAVTAASLMQQKPALVDLHVVAEPQGHTTPKGADAMAAAWIARQLAPPK